MTRNHNIGHIHNANFVQTQWSTSHPKIALFEKLKIYIFVEIFRLRVKIRNFWAPNKTPICHLLTLSIWARTDKNSWNQSKKLLVSFFFPSAVQSSLTGKSVIAEAIEFSKIFKLGPKNLQIWGAWHSLDLLLFSLFYW